MFDIARYLSYSKSVDYFDGSIRGFNLQSIDDKKNLNNFLLSSYENPIQFEEYIKTD
tara:strand:- start:212 stop:382 length:171 start_codon:yes stop_codon:yes gene_type:complete